MKGQLHTRNV